MTDYGRKLSDDEYQRAVADLHAGAPAMPSREEDREIRRKELQLMIDHRLGTAFPREKRDALWEVHQRIEKKRLRLALRQLMGLLAFRSTVGRAHSIAAFMVDEYARVIGRSDAEAFFDLEPGERPALPVDRESGK